MKLLASALYFLAGLASGIAVALTGPTKRGTSGPSSALGSTGSGGPATGESLKMVLVCNKSLQMGKGKIAAQCAHAACGCVESAERTDAGRRKLRAWRAQGQKKIALTATQDEVLRLERALRNAGINCCLISDAGKTQVAAGSKTVLGVGPDTDDRIDRFTSSLRLL